MHFAERLTVHLGLRHEDALRHNGSLLSLPVNLNLGTYEGDGSLGVVAGADGIHLVAYMDGCIPGRRDYLVAMLVVRADKGTAEELRKLRKGLAFEGLVLHAQGEVVRLCVRVVLLHAAYLLFLLVELNAADVADGNGGTDDADNAKGISAGVTGGNVLPLHVNAHRIDGFLRRAKTRRVGHGTIKHAHRHGETRFVACVEHEEVKHEQRSHIEQHDADGHKVHLDAVLLERLEEARAHLQTNTVDEQYQSEVLDKVEHLGWTGIASVRVGNTHLVVDVSHHDAGEQHERNPQRDAANLVLAQHYAEGNDKREQQHDVRYGIGRRK